MSRQPLARGLVTAVLFLACSWAQVPGVPTTPQFLTSELPSATAGRPYQFRILANGGLPPYRWQLQSAPGGLSVNNDGVLSGQFPASLESSILLRITDQRNSIASRTYRFRVAPPPSISLGSQPTGIVGRAFSLPFLVSGGVSPRAVTLAAGTLPAGLQLTSGTLQGIPTAAGSSSLTVRTEDQNGATAELAVVVRVLEPLTILTTSPLPQGAVGSPYSATLTSRGGGGAAVWSIESGTLPPGITLSANGRLAGVPTRVGDFNAVIRLQESIGGVLLSVNRAFILPVRPLLTITTPGFLPEGLQGQPYFQQLQVTGGRAPFQWSVADGVLPAGLGLSGSGVLQGVPTAQGFFGFTIRVGDASGAFTTRQFVLSIVIPPAPPRVDFTPDFLTFEITEQGASETQILNLSATTTANYTLTVQYQSSARDWLSLLPTVAVTANQSASIAVTADPRLLLPGTYGARIIADGPGAPSLAVPVSLIVTRGTRSILTTPAGLTFTAVEGGPPPPPRRVSILNRGVGAMNWTLTGQSLSGGDNWLVLPNRSFVSEAGRATTTTIRVNPAGLAAGEYYARVQVNAPDAINSPQELVVVLLVRPASSPVEIGVEPTGLVLGPGSEELFLTNSSAEDVDFFTSRVTSTAQPWFEVEPEAGRVARGGEVRLFLRVFLAGLPRGVYRGTLQIALSNGQRRSVDVVLAAPGGTPALTDSPAARAADVFPSANCSPTQLVPISTLIGNNFTVPAGWPTPVEVRVVDDCGAPLDRGSVSVAFTNGDPPLNLASVGGGRWSGTWVGRNAITPQVTMTVRAEDPVTALRGIYQATGGVQLNASPPVLAAGGIVSAATYAARAPLAPGMFIAIFGSRLATATATASRLPLESTLGVTSVTLGGRLLPLQFASDGQINAVVPFGLPLDSPQGLLVRRGTTLSVPEQVIISSAQPGVFSLDQRGSGQGAVVNVAGQVVDERSPAHGGDTVSAFGTGLGATNPPVVAGQPAPASPLAQTRSLCSASVGGVAATVSYCGMTPGFTGLYQVNLTIPRGVARGDRVPLVVTIDGRSSQPVTLAIR